MSAPAHIFPYRASADDMRCKVSDNSLKNQNNFKDTDLELLACGVNAVDN